MYKRQGSDEIYDALLKQSGAIRVDTMEELFDYATAFSKQPLPLTGDLVIVSNAGGPAIISTDACSKMNIKMADITSVRKKLMPLFHLGEVLETLLIL